MTTEDKKKPVPVTMEDTLAYYGKKFFGQGAAAQAAQKLKDSKNKTDKEIERQTEGSDAGELGKKWDESFK